MLVSVFRLLSRSAPVYGTQWRAAGTIGRVRGAGAVDAPSGVVGWVFASVDELLRNCDLPVLAQAQEAWTNACLPVVSIFWRYAARRGTRHVKVEITAEHRSGN